MTKNAKEVLSLRKAYTLAQKNKSGDRLTQADIKDAKEALYGKPKKSADYGAIKDYAELSTGGEINVGKGGDYIKDLIK